MRFWQKIFFSSLSLLIAAFLIGAYVLISYSYNFSLKREEDTSMREQVVILSSLENRLMLTEELYSDALTDKTQLADITKSLAEYYSNRDISFALYLDTDPVYSNAPIIENELLSIVDSGSKNTDNRVVDGVRYFYIASKIPTYPHLSFVYVRDISELDTFRYNIGKVFVVVSISVILGLGISIYILLRRLTRPIKELNLTTSEIAKGDYGRRVHIQSKDELGELSETFNIMASSVEEKVKELIKASEDKQEFIDNLAHEFRTPLTSILGYSEYLQKAVSSEEDRIQAAGYLHDAADRLKNLGGKLLDLTYLRMSGLEQKEIDVEKLLSSLNSMLMPVFEKRGLRLITKAEVRTLWGDETLLLSLLLNLTENAVRDSDDNSEVEVRRYQKDAPLIEVTDHGCGMEPHELEKITEPFYRVDKSRSRKFGGVGLGLSLCKQIAGLHEASLEIKSKPGEGTTVSVVFKS